MIKLEKEIIRIIDEENKEKKNFPEFQPSGIYSEELEDFWTLEKMVKNTELGKDFKENEIYNAVLRLENAEKIKTGFQNRLLVTFNGQKEVGSCIRKIGRYLLGQWIAITAIIISIFVR